MSIATRTGDAGTTGLMYNRRVSKTHPRVEACGSIDELNAALGLARVQPENAPLQERLQAVQKQLIIVMGEIATPKDDLARYAADGFEKVTEAMVLPLDLWVREIEARNISFHGWATPGGTPAAAALDFARTVCRRAERRVQHLVELGEIENPQILIFLNRLSDCLWLCARDCEAHLAPAP